MKSLIQTTEFDSGNDIFVKIKDAVHLSIAKPYGRRSAIVMEYLSRYTESQIETFIEKLAESKWVRNPQFSYERLVREDIVGELLSGGMSAEVSKHYNVVTLVVER